MQSDTNKSVLLNIAKGDEHAFRQLFDTYHHKLGAYVYNWTKSTELTEELTQDIFLKLWLKRTTLPQIENFDNYLFIIARNHTFNLLQKIASEKLKIQQWVSAHAGLSEQTPDDTLNNLYIPLLEKAMLQLPPQQLKVFKLKMQEGLKYQQIAELLQISPETVKKHLSASVKNVTKYVEAHISIALLLVSIQL